MADVEASHIIPSRAYASPYESALTLLIVSKAQKSLELMTRTADGTTADLMRQIVLLNLGWRLGGQQANKTRQEELHYLGMSSSIR